MSSSTPRTTFVEAASTAPRASSGATLLAVRLAGLHSLTAALHRLSLTLHALASVLAVFSPLLQPFSGLLVSIGFEPLAAVLHPIPLPL